MLAKELRPVGGVGVMIFKDGKILLGKRKSVLGGGTYCWPGGHIENMESIVECVKRETMEEAGIEIGNIQFLRVFNLKNYPPKHFIDLAFKADWISGEPKVVEPDKFESWSWYDLDNLPSPLFAGMDKTLDSYKTGQVFYDA